MRATLGLRKGLSFYLGLLVAGVVIPYALVIGGLLWQVGAQQTERLQEQLRNRTQAIAASLDRDFQGLMATVEVLAQSPYLKNDDFNGFRGQAQAIIDRLGVNVVVRNLAGQQVFNSRVPAGHALPARVLPSDAEAIRTGIAAISDLFTGELARGPILR